MKVGFISLGCAKNRVDTEIMIAVMKQAGHRITNRLERADIIVINTCGFIDAAKEEAINTIIDTGKYKAGQLQYLVATGCLAQRYGQELLEQMPELDGVVGISFFKEIDQAISRIQKGERPYMVGRPPDIFIEKGPRVLTTPAGSAYLKITEGCSNRCTYCSIPSIRGNLRSRPEVEIVEEAQGLVKRGVRELVLIGQDTAVYGQDIGDPGLLHLLEQMATIEGLEWIRLMYLHPAHIDDDLIEAAARLPKVLPYMDIPIQHASDRMLMKMNRRHTLEQLDTLLGKLRERIAGLVLRTTVMVGFPGESDEDFQQLLDFVRATEFDWLGAFAFAAEEGTPASLMPEQVSEEVKRERLNAVMQIQQGITRQKNELRVGRDEDILISSKAGSNLYLGRAYFQAPEVDGLTMVKSQARLRPGSLVKARLIGIRDYDMIGEPFDEYSE
ncbi:MAG: 30S ribosomal protein S12 methylthiotransferase RimO [Syntrophomonadaceae bacterium]